MRKSHQHILLEEGNMNSNFTASTTVTQGATIVSNTATPAAVVSPIATTPTTNTAGTPASDNLFVTNLSSISLEELVKKRLEVHFQQQTAAEIDPAGLKLYDIVLRQVEKPLLELALRATNGNQVKTAQMLGINRNTLKKKIDIYKIRVKRNSASNPAVSN